MIAPGDRVKTTYSDTVRGTVESVTRDGLRAQVRWDIAPRKFVTPRPAQTIPMPSLTATLIKIEEEPQ